MLVSEWTFSCKLLNIIICYIDLSVMSGCFSIVKWMCILNFFLLLKRNIADRPSKVQKTGFAKYNLLTRNKINCT